MEKIRVNYYWIKENFRLSAEVDVWCTKGTPDFLKLVWVIPPEFPIRKELFLLNNRNFLCKIIFSLLLKEDELKQKRTKFIVFPTMTRQLVIIFALYQLRLWLWDPKREFIESIIADGPWNLIFVNFFFLKTNLSDSETSDYGTNGHCYSVFCLELESLKLQK